MTVLVREWAEFANIPKRAIKDVIVTGGNANYNYTPYSDIDLHLVVDKEQIDCPAVLDDYLQSKKQLWALTHDITVKGQPVELYAQDYKDPFREGQGYLFSPVKQVAAGAYLRKTSVNHPEVKRKVKDFMFHIDALIDSNSDDRAPFKKPQGKTEGYAFVCYRERAERLLPRTSCSRSFVTVDTSTDEQALSESWKIRICHLNK